MTGAELKTIRESLLLSAQGLAERLAQDRLLPVGNVRTVQRWEEGARPVPEDIAAAVRALDAAVETMVQRGLGMVRAAVRQSAPVVLLRYESELDHRRYHPEDARASMTHRLHTAALVRLRRDAEALGQVVRIVSMDREAYEAWRFQAGLEDDPGTRAAWGALQLTEPAKASAGVIDEGFINMVLRQVQQTAVKIMQHQAKWEEMQALVEASCEHAMGVKTHDAKATLLALAGRLGIHADLVPQDQPVMQKAMLDSRALILAFVKVQG